MSKHSKTVLVIHGPNLNMLGKREPDIYGKESLNDINTRIVYEAKVFGMELTAFQSNHEGDIVEKIHQAFEEKTDGIIINPAAFTHTSIAIKDALLMLSSPIVEVHLSNIYKREAFRHRSMVSNVATGQISGFGSMGYSMALIALNDILKSE